MTAQQLIESLQKVSPDKEVYYKDRDPILGVSLFEINEVLEMEEGVVIE